MLQRYGEVTATSILLERDIWESRELKIANRNLCFGNKQKEAENLKLQIEIFVLGTNRKTKRNQKKDGKKTHWLRDNGPFHLFRKCACV